MMNSRRMLMGVLFTSKHVTDHFIREEVAVEVADDLMDLYNDFSIGAKGELGRLDVRIDHRPLVCPILTHSINSVYVAAFHSICPHDFLVHGREHALHVASVEPIVNTLQKLHFIRH